MSMGYNKRPSDYNERKGGYYMFVDYPTEDGSHYIFVPYLKFGGNSAYRPKTREEQRREEERRREEVKRKEKERRIEEAKRKEEERKKEKARRIEKSKKAKLEKKQKKKEERKNKKNIFIKRITNKCEDILKEKNIIFDVIDKIDDTSILEKLISIMERENEELRKEIKGIENSSNKIILIIVMIISLIIGVLSATIGLELIGIINLLYASGTLIDFTKKSNAKKQRLDAINYLNIKLEENIKKYEGLKEENNEIKETKIKNLKILKNLNNSISLCYNNNYNNKICYKNYKKYYKSLKEIKKMESNCVDVDYGFIEDNQNTSENNKSKTLVKKI